MRRAALALALALLGACDDRTGPDGSVVPPPLPDGPWLGIESRLMDEGLVGIVVSMAGQPAPEALADYADCAVVHYAVIRDYGFARHIRTSFSIQGGIHRADAVYTLSKAYPAGVEIIDAEVKLADCKARGIPTI